MKIGTLTLEKAYVGTLELNSLNALVNENFLMPSDLLNTTIRYTLTDNSTGPIIPVNIQKNIISNTYNSTNQYWEIVFDDILTEIGYLAFATYSNLVSIRFPNSVTTIGMGAFLGCSNLSSVILSNKLTSIEDSIFGSCERLTYITIPPKVTRIGAGSFTGCTDLTFIAVPHRVTTIGSNAFAACNHLTTVTLPKGITSISEYAFTDCSTLATINYYGTTADWNNIAIGQHWNDNVPATSVYCTDGTVQL